MRIHSDTISGRDLHDSLAAAGLLDVSVEYTAHGSRKRAGAYEFRLAAVPKEGRRRRRNTGTHGAEDGGQPIYTAAASWDEHGAWMAELFEIDPEAIVGPYEGREEFHRVTRGAYLPTTV